MNRRVPRFLSPMQTEHAFILVFFLVTLPAVLAILGVAIETARLFLIKRQAQAATDAAALSAAAGVPHYRKLSRFSALKNDSIVVTLMSVFNGVDQPGNLVLGKPPALTSADLMYFRILNNQIQLLPPGVDNGFAEGVRIRHTYSVPLIMGQLVGMESADVTVESYARLSVPRWFGINFPIALLSCAAPQPDKGPSNDIGLTSSCNDSFTLRANDEGGNSHSVSLNPAPTDTAAIFSPADQGPASAAVCKNRIWGTPPPLLVGLGAMINLNNGNQTSCLKELQQRCDKFGCSDANPLSVTVPVLDCNDFRSSTNPQFVQDAPVRGFAQIGITNVEPKGSDKEITFIIQCNLSQSGAPPTAGSPFGLFGPPVLIR